MKNSDTLQSSQKVGTDLAILYKDICAALDEAQDNEWIATTIPNDWGVQTLEIRWSGEQQTLEARISTPLKLTKRKRFYELLHECNGRFLGSTLYYNKPQRQLELRTHMYSEDMNPDFLDQCLTGDFIMCDIYFPMLVAYATGAMSFDQALSSCLTHIDEDGVVRVCSVH